MEQVSEFTSFTRKRIDTFFSGEQYETDHIFWMPSHPSRVKMDEPPFLLLLLRE